ncbi:nucleotidyltransferase domain-containing protein [Arthrobacter rhombi]|uniref:nucleotidyltransferase domain-containing protein n=1 Tax=Arthrobacter rhombi TaxID=71253 RepID=UPI003FD1A83B
MRDPREGLNADGTIRTGACRERVPTAFEPIILDVLDVFNEVADDSSELLLYGSVATGTACVGRSDVDLVAIDTTPEWCREVGQELSVRFSKLCRGVEIGHASRHDSLGNGDKFYGNRVFLRHYCTSLSGPNVAGSWAPFQGDARAARGFNGDIGLSLTRWRSDTVSAQSIARKTLLAASGVVSVLDRTWTTDRGTAANRWVEIEPCYTHEVAMLLKWIDDDSTATATELNAVLSPNGIVANVTNRFADTIGLWQ